MKKILKVTSKNVVEIFKEVEEKLKEAGVPKGKEFSGHYFYKGHDIYFRGIRDLKKQIKIIDNK